MTWIQRQTAETMGDDALWDYLRESHRLISLKLTRRLRKELGLLPALSRPAMIWRPPSRGHFHARFMFDKPDWWARREFGVGCARGAPQTSRLENILG